VLSRSLDDDVALMTVLRALGEPSRWEMLVTIAQAGEVGMAPLEESLALTKSSVSYHTRVLYDAGLIRVKKVGRNRLYSVRQDRVDELIQRLAGCSGLALTA
jgi:DNA-binding transcriptional ArsR family regulator